MTGVRPIKSPLHSNHNNNDENGSVAVNFQHGLQLNVS
jgi:hypothetical protein